MTGHAPLRSGLRLRHGERIYGRADGRETSPFDAAVEALMRNDGRRCYINLFDTKRDAPDSAPEPPPGLVGLQFHVEDPKSTARLHAVATFRHLE